MSEVFTLESQISFWNVDRSHVVTLNGLFQLFQEAAIKHADRHDVGSRAMITRGETWVLNRISASIRRYPSYEEKVRVETWSGGINGFKGYRELRLYAGTELLAEASTLWLYLNYRTKTFVRVPAELADSFPKITEGVFHPDLDRLRLEEPAVPTHEQAVTLRYADIDSNGHVNNVVYFDYLQTALAGAGLPPRPSRVELHYQKEITPTLPAVTLKVQRSETQALVSFGHDGECFTRARVS